ncbi:MAG: hypothetical protein ACPID1_08005 [Poseidonia sp.]
MTLSASGWFIEAIDLRTCMAGKAQRAWLLMAMLVLMLIPANPAVLEEGHNPSLVAPASDMIADFSMVVGGGAEVVDVGHVGQTFAVAVSHDGAGSLGSYTWSGQSGGGLLLTIAHNGSVVNDAFIPYVPRMLATSSSTVLMVANQTSTGLVVQAYNDQLTLEAEQVLTSTTTSGSQSDLNFHDASLDGTDAYLVVGCPNGGVELNFFSTTCAVFNGRTSLSTVLFDTQTNATQLIAQSKWLASQSTWMEYMPGQTGGGYTTVGPNPVCPQSLYAHNGTLEGLANAHCDGRRQTNAQHATSLFGSTSTWSASGANSIELAMGMTFSSYNVNAGSENFDGDLIAFESCNSGIDIEVDVNHHGSHSALFITGWTGGGNQECSLIEHEAADAGDTSREITTFKGRNSNMGLLGTTDFSSGIAVKSSRDFIAMTATSDAGTGYAAVCHSGSLTSDDGAIVVGGQIEQVTMIAWQGASIVNATPHTADAGCPEAIAAGMGDVLMLQNDGVLQTLTFFGRDADGDGYGWSADAFPYNNDQWSDVDGDGYGDNPGFTTSDDCPFAYGNSSLGRRGCADIDGDQWSDDTDAFPHDGTQWADEDGDGYGDNTSGNLGDDCPNNAGASTRDRRGCLDIDFDGFSDLNDRYPSDPTQWADSDGDNYGDNPLGVNGDSCPETYGNSTMGVLGCEDQDGDGYADQIDDLPLEPTQWDDLDGDGYGDSMLGENYDEFKFDPTQQTDTDGDGYGDNMGGTRGDACPDEYGTSTADRFGCVDSDGDGWSDAGDGFPTDNERWIDTDGDGYEDTDDAFPFDPTQWYDSDGDGFGDNLFGSNADRFPMDGTQWYDIDGDGYGDNPEGDNYDAFLAEPSQWSDTDGDGCGDNPNGRNPDLFPNDSTQCFDLDGDGFGDNLSGNNPDPYLYDFDNDGYNDSEDVLPKFYSPGDVDNDGVPDGQDAFPTNPLESADNDGDGIGDFADPDDDNDGVLDDAELNAGTDPYDATSKPIDSFEIILPGTSIGLGAWDLIGVFVGIPITVWIMIGILTRGGRAKRYEGMLRDATRREDLEEVALAYERAVMMRMLGPHQAIRLERLRTELDDELEQAMHAAYSGQAGQSTEEQWAEYYRQQAAYEAAQSTEAEQAYAKDIPEVP